MTSPYVQVRNGEVSAGQRANAALCRFIEDVSLSVSLALVKNGKCYAKFFTGFEDEDS